MKKISLYIKFSLCFLIIAIGVGIYFEVKDPSELRQFRRTDQYTFTNSENPSLNIGLSDLNISGSARINLPSFRSLLADIKLPIYVIDLYGEPHCFIQGLPSRWYGYSPETFFTKKPKLPKLTQVRFLVRRFFRTGKLLHQNQDVQSEKEMLEEAGYNYFEARYRRGDIPPHKVVDKIVHIFTNLPNPCWVHFHCSAGQGRTTVVMAMYDILKNGKKVSLETIIDRHSRMRGANLFDTTVWPNGSYTKEALEKRKNFIVHFYEYINDPKGYGTCSWTKWAKVKGIKDNGVIPPR